MLWRHGPLLTDVGKFPGAPEKVFHERPRIVREGRLLVRHSVSREEAAMSDESREPRRPVYSQMEVIGRCKQCGGPITDANKVRGPTGVFCSDACRETHEAFIRKAQALDARPKPGLGIGFKLKTLLFRLILLVLALCIVGGASQFINIPYVSQWVWNFLHGMGVHLVNVPPQ